MNNRTTAFAAIAMGRVALAAESATNPKEVER
jgi:hypothetical protein